MYKECVSEEEKEIVEYVEKNKKHKNVHKYIDCQGFTFVRLDVRSNFHEFIGKIQTSFLLSECRDADRIEIVDDEIEIKKRTYYKVKCDDIQLVKDMIERSFKKDEKRFSFSLWLPKKGIVDN